MVVRPGFKIELVAAEPLVMDPVAFDWGNDGRLWVVEMADYPIGIDGLGKPGGRIRVLTDTDNDGRFDTSKIFLDHIPFPSGIMMWRSGILVSSAPDIFYAEDKDGDGVCDHREVLYTGFGQGNQQHRVNGFTWGLDNWVYCANGDSGGVIKSVRTGKSINLQSYDLRIQPDTGELDLQMGSTQFGRSRDDWDNWFGNSNTIPMWHYALQDHYLRRNPLVVFPGGRKQLNVDPGADKCFPVSQIELRFNEPFMKGHFTSACSAIIYRDELFGQQFAGNFFVSEPVHNIVHREIVSPDGVSFTSRRAEDERESEGRPRRGTLYRRHVSRRH
jgi:putative membrane-bound dehydrogenase-like protein